MGLDDLRLRDPCESLRRYFRIYLTNRSQYFIEITLFWWQKQFLNFHSNQTRVVGAVSIYLFPTILWLYKVQINKMNEKLPYSLKELNTILLYSNYYKFRIKLLLSFTWRTSIFFRWFWWRNFWNFRLDFFLSSFAIIWRFRALLWIKVNYKKLQYI